MTEKRDKSATATTDTTTMTLAATLLELDTAAAQRDAFDHVGDLFRDAHAGLHDYARQMAGAIYGIALRQGRPEDASKAACAAAFACDAAGDAAACAVWAELCLRIDTTDTYDWAALAHTLAAAGHRARGAHGSAQHELRIACALVNRATTAS